MIQLRDVKQTQFGNLTKMRKPYWNTHPGRDDALYVARSSCGAIKIGRSGLPEDRVRNIEMQSPPSISITLLFQLKGLGQYEQTLHELFDEHRLRGEWFAPVIGPVLEEAYARDALLQLIEDAIEQQSASGYRPKNKLFAAHQAHRVRAEQQAWERQAGLLMWQEFWATRRRAQDRTPVAPIEALRRGHKRAC